MAGGGGGLTRTVSRVSRHTAPPSHLQTVSASTLELPTNLRKDFTITILILWFVMSSILFGIAGDEYRTYFRRAKPGAGLGWTQPRMEHVIGWVAGRIVALCLQMCCLLICCSAAAWTGGRLFLATSAESRSETPCSKIRNSSDVQHYLNIFILVTNEK